MLSYKRGNSISHSVDARVKMLWIIALLFFFFSTKTVGMAVLSALLALAACRFSSVSLSELFPKPKFIAFLILIPVGFSVILLSRQNGLEYALVYGIANATILLSALAISLLFILTTERNAIVSGLRFFLVPKQFAFSLALSFHFLPVFVRRFDSIRFAQASRGDSGRNPIPLVIPFMHAVLRSARNLSTSLDARGFDPEQADVPVKLKMKGLDWFALAMLAAIIAIRIIYAK